MMGFSPSRCGASSTSIPRLSWTARSRTPCRTADDPSILIDLSGCEFIDSTGIALIVRAWQRLDRDAGGEGKGRLAICCSNDQVERLLKITGVESSISMHGNRDSALADLRG